MNVLKHILYIQYGCGEELSCIVWSTPSPDYPNLDQLSQQCNSVRVPTYAYPRHMNVLKHFLYYLHYGCGEEVSGSLLWPKLCQHVIISPPNPQITLTWVNLASSVTVQGRIHMPTIHSI
jgi:hypothetical protein